MCRPNDFPPYEPICTHPNNVWCACSKYPVVAKGQTEAFPEETTNANEHLGNRPQDTEADVLRAEDSDRGSGSLRATSYRGRVATGSHRSGNRIQRGDSVILANPNSHLGPGTAVGPIGKDEGGPWLINLDTGRSTLALPSELERVYEL